MPLVLHLGLSGVGHRPADASGFNGPQANELYVRWLQFAASKPFMRPHGYGATAPVDYPEPYRSMVRQYTRLHQRLLPYTYTLA